MKKYLYYYYNLFFFRAHSRGRLSPFSYSYSKIIASSYLAIVWLKLSTEYIIQMDIKNLYKTYLKYDGISTNGILQTPKRLRELSLYGYLYNRVWMGWIPTLKTNQISLSTIIKLNPYKKDKKFTKFLNAILIQHWDNPERNITKNKIDNLLK